MTATVYSKGVNKTVVIASETSYGVQSTAVGQLLRRVTCTLTPTTQLTPSQEIVPSQQVRDARQGPRQINGTLTGQLSPTSYSVLHECLLRNQFSAAATVTLTDLYIVINANTVGLGSATVNLSTTFQIGDVITPSGLASAAAANNGLNFRILSFTNSGKQAVCSPVTGTVGILLANATNGTLSLVGRKLFPPSTGALFPSFSMEEWYSDTQVSDLSLGMVITQMQVQMPARGFCTFTATLLGQNQLETSTQVFTTPTAPTTTPSLAMLGGAITYNGTILAYVSNASLSIASTVQADPMAGSNLIPAIFLGTLSVTGSFTTLMASDALTNDFLAENEVDLSFNMVTANRPNAPFIQFYMPRVKLSAATKTDSDRAISRNFSFQALENLGTNANAPLTSIVLQDAGQAAPV